jgi:hypothetical protein
MKHTTNKNSSFETYQGKRQMQFPHKDSASDRVCRFIYEEGPVTSREVHNAIGISQNAVSRAYDQGYLERMDGKRGGGYVFDLKAHVKRWLKEGVSAFEGEVAGPRIIESKPWSGKYSLPTDRINPDKGYMTASAVPSFYWDSRE